MKSIKLIAGITIFLIVGCNSFKEIKTSNIDNEIQKLETAQNKRTYLEKIFEEDQKVRDGSISEIMLEYGNNSKEYEEYINNLINLNDLNLQKIEKYIAKFGHPQKSEVGEIAAMTPFTIIHHANDYDSRERNFEHLHKAYLNGDIDDGAISMFLGRMYEMKFKERFRMQSPYKSEDEIYQLIKELELNVNRPDPNQIIKRI